MGTAPTPGSSSRSISPIRCTRWRSSIASSRATAGSRSARSCSSSRVRSRCAGWSRAASPCSSTSSSTTSPTPLRRPAPRPRASASGCSTCTRPADAPCWRRRATRSTGRPRKPGWRGRCSSRSRCSRASTMRRCAKRAVETDPGATQCGSRRSRANAASTASSAPRRRRVAARRLRSRLPLVTPGIRPAGSSADDQVRIVTPERAVRDGADHLVIGRPITRRRRSGGCAASTRRSQHRTSMIRCHSAATEAA